MAPTKRDLLGDIGQDAEHVRERVELLMGRLEDARSLADEFQHIVDPVRTFIQRYTSAEAKVLELTSVLSREGDLRRSLRQDLSRNQEALAKAEDDLAAAVPRIQTLESTIRGQQAELTLAQMELEKEATRVAGLQQQLALETGRADSLHGEAQAYRLEVDTLGAKQARIEADLTGLRDHVKRLEAENTRLQGAFDALTQKYAAVKSHVADLEPQLHARRLDVAALESRLLGEQTARQKAEQSLEAERTLFYTDQAALILKIEGLNSHAETTDRLLAHARDQLRDTAEALRLSERAVNILSTEKVTLERRIETEQASAARQAAQIQQLQKAHGDLQSRSEMMTKALAAKDVAIDEAVRKHSVVSARIDEMTTRWEQDRLANEALTRRLMDELQTEKAERSLAQGALDIARNSRLKLLTLNSELRKKHSGGEVTASVEDEERPRQLEFSNVHVFKANDRESDRLGDET